MKTPEYGDSEFAYKNYAWSVDLTRKLFEMNKLRKWLFRIIIGRYAWREFCGMVEMFGEDSPLFGYGLEGCNYHKEKVKLKGW
jgi:hypothetical protein